MPTGSRTSRFQPLRARCSASVTAPTLKLPKAPEPSDLILEKLRTNYIPTPSEAKNIHDCIADLQAGVAQYDTEIACLRDALTQLTSARDALYLRAQETQSLVSPIRRIPPELVSQILILALPDNWYTSPSGSVPLIPSQVNSIWRRVAHSTGSLWSTIRLRTSRPHTVDIMNVYLSRSRDLPLSVYITHNERDDEPDDSALDAIMAHSTRWQILDLHLPMTIYERLSPLRGHLPLLETLTLATSSWEEEYYTQKLDLFSIAPKLTKVIMGQGILPLRFQLPWNQITNLRSQFASSDMDDLLEALRLFQNLDILRIYEPRMSLRGEEYSTSIVLGNLQALKIKHRARNYYIPPYIMDAFYSAISAPSMKSLSLYKLSVTTHFIPMLSRTNSLLTSINFSHLMGLSEDALIQCLQLTPALLKLKFREISGSPICSGLLFRKLTPQVSEEGNESTDQLLVPQLKILDLSLSAATVFEDGQARAMELDLVRMFSARWGSNVVPRVSQLESINLNHTFSITPDGFQAKVLLRGLRRAGLPIRLQTRD